MAEEKVQDYVEMTADEFAKWVCEGFDDITPKEVLDILRELERRAAKYDKQYTNSPEVESLDMSLTEDEPLRDYSRYCPGEDDYYYEYAMDRENIRMYEELFFNLLCGKWKWLTYDGEIEHPITQEEAERYKRESKSEDAWEAMEANRKLDTACYMLCSDWKDYCVDHGENSHDEFGFREYLHRKGISCD